VGAAGASAAGAGACDRHAPAAAREAEACDVPAASSAGASEAAVDVAERSCKLASMAVCGVLKLGATGSTEALEPET